MAEKYTLRNRRSPALRAQDADKQELRSRFAIDSIEPAPAVPSAPPRPFGDLTRAPIEGLVKLAGDKLGSQLDSPRAKRRSGTRHLLEHLETFDGRTWQERWLASGLDAGERPVSDLDPDKYRGYNLTHGLKALLCLRVITPSLHAFRGNKFNQYPYAFQKVQADPLLDKFFEEAARSRASQRHQYRALADVCCALTTQGIALADLTPEALLFYANECRRLNLVVNARPDSNRFAGLMAWDILHDMGHFPPGTPPTLRTYIYKGQRSPEEMVDFYGIRDPDVRQLIIDYIVRRQGDTDYVTREGLARAIAGSFWGEIEKIAPGQRDFNIASEVYDQWRETVRVRKDGKLRFSLTQILAVAASAAEGLLTRADEQAVEQFTSAYVRAEDQRGDHFNGVLRVAVQRNPDILRTLERLSEDSDLGARMTLAWLADIYEPAEQSRLMRTEAGDWISSVSITGGCVPRDARVAKVSPSSLAGLRTRLCSMLATGSGN